MTTLANAEAPAPPPATASETTTPHHTMVVDYWTVAMGDQISCAPSDATLATLMDAAKTLAPLAARLGFDLEVRPGTITSWVEALDHRVAASPTIRVAGRELRPVHDGPASYVRRYLRPAESVSPCTEGTCDG
jgi:hypothetical protein